MSISLGFVVAILLFRFAAARYITAPILLLKRYEYATYARR